MLRHRTVAAALIGCLAFTVPALAADTGQSPAAKPQTAAKAQPSGVDAHIIQLRKKLHITEQQTPQWNAFAQVMRDNNTQYIQLAQTRTAQLKSMNAIDDLRSFQEIAQAHADGLKRLHAAFQAVYDSMTPEQRKNADSVFHSYKQQTTRKGGA